MPCAHCNQDTDSPKACHSAHTQNFPNYTIGWWCFWLRQCPRYLITGIFDLPAVRKCPCSKLIPNSQTQVAGRQSGACLSPAAGSWNPMPLPSFPSSAHPRCSCCCDTGWFAAVHFIVHFIQKMSSSLSLVRTSGHRVIRLKSTQHRPALPIMHVCFPCRLGM